MSRVARKDKQEITRQKLISAAREMLENEGASALNIARISRDAGFTRGAFYGNFEDTADLLLEIMKERVVEELRFWNLLLEETGNANACLATIVASAQRQNRNRAVLKLELQLFAERNEAFRPVFREYLDTVHAEIKRLFLTMLSRHGKAVPADIDLKMAGVYALGSSLGLRAVLGFMEDHEKAAFTLMHDYAMQIVKDAPDRVAGNTGPTGAG